MTAPTQQGGSSVKRLMLCVAAALACAAAPPAKLTPKQAAADAAAFRLFLQARKEWDAGKRAEAAATMEKARRAAEEAHGPDGVGARRMDGWLADWARQMGRWEESTAHHKRLWRMTARLLGEGHHEAIDARGRWETAKLHQAMTSRQRERLAESDRTNARAGQLHREGDPRRALPLFAEVLAAREELLGPRHHATASALGNLSLMHTLTGDNKTALALARKALSIEKEVLGTRHPAYALGLNNLGILIREQGDADGAAALHKESLAVFRAAYGPRHPRCALAMNSLAIALEEAGDLDTSLIWYRRAAALRAELLGESAADYAKSLCGIAGVLLRRGEPREALALQQKATDILRAALGEKHPHHATALVSLAQYLAFSEDRAEGLALLRKAAAGLKAALGDRHPSHAAALAIQAEMLARAGAFAESLPLHKKALAIRKAALGVRHPDYADSLAGLGELHFFKGEFKEALSLQEQAAAIYKTALGSRHPRHAAAVTAIATTLLSAGEEEKAREASERALAASAAMLRGAASLRSDRQFLAALHLARGRLDLRLSMPDAGAYGHLLAWKGAALLRQQERRRLARLAADPVTRDAVTALQKTAARLAALARAGPPAGEMDRLAAEQERLEVELARASPRAAGTEWPLRPEAMTGSLPEGAVLIDYLLILRQGLTGKDGRPVWPFPRHALAFVARRGRPAARVELGPAAEIEQACAAWRKALLRGEAAGEAGARVKKLVWAPLEKHAAGAKVVLISPDGALGWVPFAALPGKEKGSYLIEDVALAVVPIPQALPGLLAPTKPGDRLPPSLLAVGGLRYGAADAGRTEFAALPGTATEAAAVRESFAGLFKGGTATSLTGGRATKAAVREPLGKVRYAHLATHGYFSTEAGAPAAGHARGGMVAGRNPLLLSGLALSDANRQPKRGEEDGVLTALEVSEMDLSRLELAVLSACETGLGKVMAGEGMLGMQRAFQAAGARSVVASLWKVDDEATRVLMADFYSLAWDAKSPAPLADALRKAQVALMHGRTLDGRPRGVGKLPEKVVKGVGGRLPPYYWAAFVLSGDWR
jgi:CHAT domain-containing protein